MCCMAVCLPWPLISSCSQCLQYLCMRRWRWCARGARREEEKKEGKEEEESEKAKLLNAVRRYYLRWLRYRCVSPYRVRRCARLYAVAKTSNSTAALPPGAKTLAARGRRTVGARCAAAHYAHALRLAATRRTICRGSAAAVLFMRFAFSKQTVSPCQPCSAAPRASCGSLLPPPSARICAPQLY